MAYFVAYIVALLVFVAIDAAWLTIMSEVLYRPTLGDLLAPALRLAPAVVFYLMYPVGVVVFAAAPALRAGSPTSAFVHGLLFGAIAYGTYDLTNHATLRTWALQLTVFDMAYGAVASAAAATAAYYAARAMFGSAPLG